MGAFSFFSSSYGGDFHLLFEKIFRKSPRGSVKNSQKKIKKIPDRSITHLRPSEKKIFETDDRFVSVEMTTESMSKFFDSMVNLIPIQMYLPPDEEKIQNQWKSKYMKVRYARNIALEIFFTHATDQSHTE